MKLQFSPMSTKASIFTPLTIASTKHSQTSFYCACCPQSLVLNSSRHFVNSSNPSIIVFDGPSCGWITSSKSASSFFVGFTWFYSICSNCSFNDKFTTKWLRLHKKQRIGLPLQSNNSTYLFSMTSHLS
jgi:hypothetical protein